jgi:hypothetical protein
MRWTMDHRECGETYRHHFLPKSWPDIRRTRACNMIES